MRRREFITFLGGAVAAWPLAARAQKSLPRIGWLVYGGTTLGPIDQSLKNALAQTGLVDGRNIEIVFRYANGKPDQLAGLASELVAQKPDLLVAIGGDVIKPLFEASKGGIPIVGGVSDNLVRELPCLLLGQARISPVSRISRMKWRPSGWNCSKKLHPTQGALR
jgi:putative ABC transport system substrate-binding protein